MTEIKSTIWPIISLTPSPFACSLFVSERKSEIRFASFFRFDNFDVNQIKNNESVVCKVIESQRFYVPDVQ